MNPAASYDPDFADPAFAGSHQDGGPEADPRQADSVQPEYPRPMLGVRILHSVFFCLVLQVVSAALGLVFFYQLVYALVSARRPDSRVTEFGETLSRYLYEIFRYLTFNRERGPFPLSDWRSSTQGPRA